MDAGTGGHGGQGLNGNRLQHLPAGKILGMAGVSQSWDEIVPGKWAIQFMGAEARIKTGSAYPCRFLKLYARCVKWRKCG